MKEGAPAGKRSVSTVWPARSTFPPGPENPSEIMRENKK
jgi:hypothetical protein